MPPLDRAAATSVGDGPTEGGSEPNADRRVTGLEEFLERKTFAVPVAWVT
jgi:hypothetical protein